MIKKIFEFIKLIVKSRYLIMMIAKREVTMQYVGSYIGFFWVFIHPLVLITVFWFVFSVGFKVQPTNDVPFVVWLAAGMAAWFVFADIVNGSTHVLVNNAHLIKKTVFPPQILPVVKVLSCLTIHAVFLVILLGLIFFQDLPFCFYFLQSLYYLFCLSILGLGIGWIVSALNAFIRDIGQVVGVFLQVGFWATPIFWDIDIMPPNIQFILKLNPMFYVVEGYRESFIYFRPFWAHPAQMVYFWVLTMVIFFSGALVFKQLKGHFADAL